eukprot:NODE_153_length_16933_cov_0.442141.p14 type:complete len:105 gc:universal NODE_153_length_16933_cov_0.442141:1980-2294(+)
MSYCLREFHPINQMSILRVAAFLPRDLRDAFVIKGISSDSLQVDKTTWQRGTYLKYASYSITDQRSRNMSNHSNAATRPLASLKKFFIFSESVLLLRRECLLKP